MRDVVTIAKALSDENRVRILAIIEGRELCVCQVIELLGLAPSTVSKHLSILKHARLIDGRKHGRWMYYRLAGEDVPAVAKDAIGWARHLKGEVIDAYSAGTHPKGLDPLAVQVMAEVGVDLSTHQVKSLDAVRYLPFDYVVTVCRDAHETCPVFPGRAGIVHRGFDDPPRLAATAQSPEEALRHYVRVRDEIKAFIEQLSVLLGFRLLAPVGERQMTAQLIVRRWRVSPFDQQECSREKSPVNRPMLESSTRFVDIHIINYF